MIINIPRISNSALSITLGDGEHLFMVGPNGSGKSALIQHLVSSHGEGKIRRIIAHRQTAFHSERANFRYPDRGEFEQRIMNWDRQPDARWKEDHQFGQEKQLAVLSDLIDKENFQARSIRDLVRDYEICKARKLSPKSASPFGQINELFRIGNLSATLLLSHDGQILAHHGDEDKTFSIAQMSDGERSAVIMAATVLTIEPGTVLLIDEPERHLHRSIIEPFLSALFVHREDCAFIVSTHEIALPIANPDALTLMIRSCEWNGKEAKAWDVDLLETTADLPEELKFSVLGARRKILFVEGTTNSVDLPLYNSLFPGLSVIPKGSCIDVQRAVSGLKGSQGLHHVEAYGLIDRDDRPSDEIEQLVKTNVFALDVYSTEALYYCSDTISAIAHWQEKALGSESNKLIEITKTRAIDVLKKDDLAERMAARRCERRVRNQLFAKLPDWKAIQVNPTSKIKSCLDSPYSDELSRFKKLVSEEQLDELVARYPLRESPMFDIIAKSLECNNRRDYQRMVLARVRNDRKLANKLKARINSLSHTLDPNFV